jgi:hypothetical protein
MKRLRLAGVEADLIKGILPFCVVFIGLNILDAWLTKLALGLGSYELNPFLGIIVAIGLIIWGVVWGRRRHKAHQAA